MASNPMQRKARVSFFLGMILALLIGGVVVLLLFMKIKNLNAEIQAIQSAKVSVYVFNTDVKSGQLLDSSMFTLKEVDRSTVPTNSTSDIVTTLNSYSLRDKSNHPISLKLSDGNEKHYYIKIEQEEYTLYTVDSEGKETVATLLTPDSKAYYYTNNNTGGEKVNIEIMSNAIVAKIDVKSNTVATGSLITRSDLINKDDIRIQEYNVLVLPTDLSSGDYVDVRLMLPNGQDYIVVSKKEINVPQVGTEYLEGTITMKLAEEEILSMSSAIVEAFRMEGSKLYVTKYAEAGIQGAASTTYPVNNEVATLIESDPNILKDALNGLRARYNGGIRNDYINPALSQYGKEEGINQKMQESITSTKESRTQWLQSFAGGTE